MLTIAEIRNKVNGFPDDRPVEELLDELVLLYKIEKGRLEAENGQGLTLDEFNQKLDEWWKSK